MEKKSFKLKELATLTQSRLVGDPNHLIEDVADLESATPCEASFLSNPKYTSTRYENAMKATAAGVIFVAPTVTLIEGKNFLVNEDPSRAFQTAIEAIKRNLKFTGYSGIHHTAIIHPSCKINGTIQIGPYVVIDEGTTIENGTFIGSGVYIGPYSKIGSGCTIHPHVTIRENCIIGNHVILQPGVVVGSCGFGYSTDKKGVHTKLNHLGNVVIEDDVEIGANSTIDRARFTSTRIGKGSKIDNLVTIAHNVKVGEHNLIAGQTGIAGSTETGNHVVLAGQCGVNGHIKITDGVIVSAKSGVSKSLEKPGVYGGQPAIPIDEHNRHEVYRRKIKELFNRINKLEQGNKNES